MRPRLTAVFVILLSVYVGWQAWSVLAAQIGLDRYYFGRFTISDLPDDEVRKIRDRLQRSTGIYLDPFVQRRLVLSHIQLGDWQAAQRANRTLVAANPMMPHDWVREGFIALQFKDTAHAAQAYRMARDTGADLPRLRVQLANLAMWVWPELDVQERDDARRLMIRAWNSRRVPPWSMLDTADQADFFSLLDIFLAKERGYLNRKQRYERKKAYTSPGS